MFCNNQVCSVCASETGVKGCICSDSIKLIGNSCLNNHLSESEVDHNLVDLDLALRMQADPSLIKSYLKRLPRLNRAINFLRESSKNIKKYKIVLEDSKNRLIAHIEEVFGSLNGAIEEANSEISMKLKCLSKYKSNLCEDGRVLMDEYRAKRSKHFLKNSIHAIEIPIDEICHFITDNIKIHTSNSTIQHPIPNSVQDLRIKLQEKDAIIEELSQKIHNFQKPNSLLPLQQYNNTSTFTKHTDTVYSVCMSGDGRWIVSGSYDETVRIWSLENKTQEAALTGHTSYVNSVCMSGDGRWIVSGSSDNTVRIWSVANKTQQAVLTGHTDSVSSVCISGDGRWIVSGSEDKTVRIWSLANKTQEAVLTGHTKNVTSVCMSGDGKWIVSGSQDRTIRIWSLANKTQQAVLTGHTSEVWSVCMSVDGRWIVSGSGGSIFGSGDCAVRIWS
jgi:hypothetical protein